MVFTTGVSSDYFSLKKSFVSNKSFCDQALHQCKITIATATNQHHHLNYIAVIHSRITIVSFFKNKLAEFSGHGIRKRKVKDLQVAEFFPKTYEFIQS